MLLKLQNLNQLCQNLTLDSNGNIYSNIGEDIITETTTTLLKTEFKVKFKGMYMINCGFRISDTVSSSNYMSILKNGNVMVDQQFFLPKIENGTHEAVIPIFAILDINITDIITIRRSKCISTRGQGVFTILKLM